MSAPRVSVVVPAYNATATIAATLQSIARQTFEDFELIVVDDGSTDATPEVVEETLARDPRLRLVRQENGGTAQARNTGLAQARGELVSFLDNDDLWMPLYLERMTRALDEEPGAALSYTDAWILDDRTKRINARTSLEFSIEVPRVISAPVLLRTLLRENFIMSSVTARRRIVAEVGGFSSALSGVDDYDLWLRLAAAGHGAVRAEGTLLIQRDRPDSQSKNFVKIIEGHLGALRRAGENADLDEETRRVLDREIERFDRWAKALRGENRSLQALYWLRREIARLRDRIGYRKSWPASPPAEVAEAFPELGSV